MKVKLLGITPNADEFIGECAAVCYDADTSPEASVKRAVSCKDKGHLATMRFATATFEVSEISRACSHQFVRSKHLDFLQESQRYVDNSSHLEYYTPEAIKQDAKYLEYYDAAMTTAHRLYKYLRAQGVKKEDARYLLPNAVHTKLIVTGNFQAWGDFLKLRLDPAAQDEIRQVATTIKEILHEQYPKLF